jgi:hypothetical protein
MGEFLSGAYDRAELSAADAVGLLAYPDAPLDEATHATVTERTMSRENTVYYAQELQAMSDEVGLDKVLELASTMRDAGMAATRALGIEPSPYAHSVTWALWDMAKQRRTSSPEFLAEAGPDYPYRNQTGDPLTKPGIRQTIINRHVGWEIDTHLRQPGENRHIFPIAHSADEQTVDEIRRTGRRNGDAQELNSLDLARTGEVAVAALRTARHTIPERLRGVQQAHRVSNIGSTMLGAERRPDADAFHAAERQSLRLAAANIRTVPLLLKQVREWNPRTPVPPPAPIQLKPGDIRALPSWDQEQGRYVTPTSYVPQYRNAIERFVTNSVT